MEERPTKSTSLFKNKFFIICLIISILINTAIWLALYYYIPPTENPIILHYNIFFGIDLIGEWYKILYIPITGIVFGMFNYALAIVLYKKEAFLSIMSIFSVVLFHLLLIIAAVLTIFSNTV